jgi:hypothetical protein
MAQPETARMPDGLSTKVFVPYHTPSGIDPDSAQSVFDTHVFHVMAEKSLSSAFYWHQYQASLLHSDVMLPCTVCCH